LQWVIEGIFFTLTEKMVQGFVAVRVQGEIPDSRPQIKGSVRSIKPRTMTTNHWQEASREKQALQGHKKESIVVSMDRVNRVGIG
jgi:hypothetical protein